DHRGRAHPGQASGRARVRGGLDAAREVGRGAEGLRLAAPRRARQRAGADRLLPQPARSLQVPEVNRVRRAAEDVHRQDPEVRAAREGLGGDGTADPVAPTALPGGGAAEREEVRVRIVNVVGARPNLMKIAPLMDAYARAPEIEPLLVHTGQHYDA